LTFCFAVLPFSIEGGKLVIKTMSIAGGSLLQILRTLEAEHSPLEANSPFHVRPKYAWIDSGRLNVVMYAVQPTLAQFMGQVYTDNPDGGCKWVQQASLDNHTFFGTLAMSLACAVSDMHKKLFICGYASSDWSSSFAEATLTPPGLRLPQ
jgi:hypothetical protein